MTNPKSNSAAADKPQRKRRRLSLSLRTLLILFTLIVIGTAAFTSRMRSATYQAKIVAELQAMRGGRAFYSFETSQIIALSPTQSGWPTLDSELYGDGPPTSTIPEFLVNWLGIDFFHPILAVEIYETVYFSPEVGEAERENDRREFDQMISLASKLEELETISLRCSWKCNPEPLSHLRDLKLVSLNMDVAQNDLAFLQGSAVISLWLGGDADDQSLEIISELPALERLQMRAGAYPGSTAFTKNGVAKLVNLRSLKELLLNSDVVGDEVSEILPQLKNLEKLGLRLPASQQAFGQHIGRMPLQDVRLVNMVIDHDFFRQIGEMERIEVLCLEESRGYQELTEGDFSILMKSRSLREVHLDNILCSDEQYRALEKKFGEGAFSAALRP